MATGRGASARNNRGDRAYRDVIEVYADGNALRSGMPVTRQERSKQAPAPALSAQARANRERSLQMNVGYVAFLALSAVITVLMCVNYLRLQANYTSLQKQGTALETTLGQLKMDNDAQYNRIIAGVDMEHVKDVATNELGMVYASSDQIVTYDAAEHDYVKQYQEIPGNR